jgi:hypothetical protein
LVLNSFSLNDLYHSQKPFSIAIGEKSGLAAFAELQRLRESNDYRKSDPDFERAIAHCVDAEASLERDPAEGTGIGGLVPTESAVLRALNG